MVKIQDSTRKKIYLACPYGNVKSHIHLENYALLKQFVAVLMQEGHSIFSPIFQFHSLCEQGIQYDYSTWQEIAKPMISSWATDCYMLALDGFDKSQNINDEMKFSSQAGIPFRCFQHMDILSIIKDANLPQLDIPLLEQYHKRWLLHAKE